MRILHKHRDSETFMQVHYGDLFNWYAVSDSRNIAAPGWRVPTAFDFDTLINYSGGYSAGGGKLKDTDSRYWMTPNTGATNEYGFNGRAGGARLSTDGSFSIKGQREFFWTQTTSNEFTGRVMVLYYDRINISLSNVSRGSGHSVRLVKESTVLAHGQTGTYEGNDGKIYPTIRIGTQEWMTYNLAETKYRNGDSIPLVLDAVSWIALNGGARCAYNNENENSYEKKSVFARYFCPMPTYREIEAENRLRDTSAGNNQAQPTTVWKADGTAKILLEIPEKDYTAGIIAVTGNNMPVSLGYTYEANYSTPFGTKSGYLVTSAAQNLNNLKVYNPASYTPTNKEKADLNLDGSQAWIQNQFVLESGAGTGTTDNMIVFDRLNTETFGYILNAVDGDTWTTDATITSIIQADGCGISVGTELTGSLEAGVIIPIKANTNLTILNTQPDYTRPAGYHFEFTGRNCIKGDGTAKLTFANLPAYDAITAKIDGKETAITLTANEYVMESGKYYTDIVFKNTGAVVEKFWLADLDNEKNLPTTLVCYGNYKNGATATVNLGSSLIIEKCDGISPNYIYGFATIDADNVMYPRLADGSGYAGLTGNETGITEYLPVLNDGAKSSFTYSEQKIKANPTKEFIDRADCFLKEDATQLPLFTAGQPNEISMIEIDSDNGLNQVIQSPVNKNIIDIKLK